jgi:transcriptional regulator with XRE-family HTH domain
MADDIAPFDTQDFIRSLAKTLQTYLDGRMKQNEAADKLGLSPQRLNNYFHTEKEPMASVLYLACARLPGFHFDYGGFRLRAVKLGEKNRAPDTQQAFDFYREIKAGRVKVKLKKPAGRVELSVSLAATTRPRSSRNGVPASDAA